MATVTKMKARVWEADAPNPHVWSVGARTGAISEAPKDAEKKPAIVTPTWTAERKRFESAVKRATALPAELFLDISSICVWRRETSAISDAENKPPISVKRRTKRMSLTSGSTPPLSPTRAFSHTEARQMSKQSPSGRVHRRSVCRQSAFAGSLLLPQIRICRDAAFSVGFASRLPARVPFLRNTFTLRKEATCHRPHIRRRRPKGRRCAS